MVKRAVRGEVGDLEGVKFVETTEVPWCTVTNAKMSSHGGGRYYFSFLAHIYTFYNAIVVPSATSNPAAPITETLRMSFVIPDAA